MEILEIRDKVRIDLDKVNDEYKKYNGVYKIKDIIIVDDNNTLMYKLDGVPNWGTEDMIILVEKGSKNT